MPAAAFADWSALPTVPAPPLPWPTAEQVTLYGALGLRYHGLFTDGDESEVLNRPEARVRLGVTVDPLSGLRLDFRLSTGDARLPAESWTGVRDRGGKTALALDRYSVSYDPFPYLGLAGGKMALPFEDGGLLWEPALGFSGLAQRFDLVPLSDAAEAPDWFVDRHRLVFGQFLLESDEQRGDVSLGGGQYQVAARPAGAPRLGVELRLGYYAYGRTERLAATIADGELGVAGMPRGATTNVVFNRAPAGSDPDWRMRSRFGQAHGGLALCWRFADGPVLAAGADYAHNLGARGEAKRLEEAALAWLRLAGEHPEDWQVVYRFRFVESDAALAPLAPEYRATNLRAHELAGLYAVGGGMTLRLELAGARREQTGKPALIGWADDLWVRVLCALEWRF